jgi:hypothetical protein
MRIEKTAFISYRRTDVAWALNVYHNLASHGYQVFFDFKGIASGDFERVIVSNIRARAHFLVVLTPSALDGSDRPEDWLRREIETALEARRNIVPLMFEGFDLSNRDIAKKLTGKLTALQRYNALEIPPMYFDEAMGRLREWLNVPLEAVLHPLSPNVQHATEQQLQAADMALAQQIAEGPLLSVEEEAFRKSLPPEQQAMMLLQARKQREQLITSVLTNLMQMRKRP